VLCPVTASDFPPYEANLETLKTAASIGAASDDDLNLNPLLATTLAHGQLLCTRNRSAAGLYHEDSHPLALALLTDIIRVNTWPIMPLIF
jgi:hypothetical protein